MNNWSPLWSGLVDSSIWEEEDHVFRVFMAMMSLKDCNHIVSMDGYRLAKRIHMPLAKVEDALKTLSEPDRKRPGQEFDGRRIKRVDDGWEIINGEYYRKLVSEEMKRVRNRRAQANWRENQKAKKRTTRSRSVDVAERAFEQSIKNGEPESEQDKIVTRSLPDNGKIPGPCSYCGAADHWRPDCPDLAKECTPKSDQLPDAGKMMVPNGPPTLIIDKKEFAEAWSGDGKPVELLLAKPVCDRCNEAGHKGDDCPIPMHLEGRKWVKD